MKRGESVSYFIAAFMTLCMGCAGAPKVAHAIDNGASRHPKGTFPQEIMLPVGGCANAGACAYALRLENVTFRSKDKGLQIQARVVRDGTPTQTIKLDELWAGHAHRMPVSLVDLSLLPVSGASWISIRFSEVDIHTNEITNLETITVGDATVVSASEVSPP